MWIFARLFPGAQGTALCVSLDISHGRWKWLTPHIRAVVRWWVSSWMVHGQVMSHGVMHHFWCPLSLVLDLSVLTIPWTPLALTQHHTAFIPAFISSLVLCNFLPYFEKLGSHICNSPTYFSSPTRRGNWFGIADLSPCEKEVYPVESRAYLHFFCLLPRNLFIQLGSSVLFPPPSAQTFLTLVLLLCWSRLRPILGLSISRLIFSNLHTVQFSAYGTECCGFWCVCRVFTIFCVHYSLWNFQSSIWWRSLQTE